MMRTAIIWLVVVVVAACGAVAAILFWPVHKSAPDPVGQSTQEVARYIASADFEQLGAKEKDGYLDAAAKHYENRADWMAAVTNLSDEERRRAERNSGPLFEKVMENQVNQYFELPPDERVAYLDKAIDQMEEMRKAFAERRRQRGQTTGPAGSRRRTTAPAGSRRRTTAPAAAGAPAGSGTTSAQNAPPRSRSGRERMRARIETTLPETRAKSAEYRRVLRLRMIQRGITFGRPGGGGPPGSGRPPGAGRPPGTGSSGSERRP